MSKLQTRLLLLIVLIAIISGVIIYMTVDVHTLSSIVIFKPVSIMLALLFLVAGMYFDAKRLIRLAKIADERITIGEALQVIFGNYFLALLTPGATGGVVAQIMFLRKAGVPFGKASVLVMVRTMMSILFLLACMPLVFYIDAGILPWLSPLFLSGIAVVLVVGCIGMMGFFYTRTSLDLVLKITRRMKHGRRRKAFGMYKDIRAAVSLLARSPIGVIWVFLESGASLLSLYAIVPALFIGLNISFDWLIVLGRMIFLNLVLYFAPTPGGAGVAEGGFVLLFGELLPQGVSGILAVMWRIIAEYVPFIIGLYFTLRVFGKDYLDKKIQ